MKKKAAAVVIVCGMVLFIISIYAKGTKKQITTGPVQQENTEIKPESAMEIEALRKREYPASEIKTEERLNPGINYSRYIASYMSDGLKIYGLLTVPDGATGEGGFPAIIFLHGYIAPQIYKTTERYVAYQDRLARNGFITFKIDLRGHDKSEGTAPGAHFSEAYTVDTLNAISAMKSFPKADPKRLGVWGHSNGGEIGLRTMVISKDIKAGVFWAGVVGSFQDELETYQSKIPFMRQTPQLVQEQGLPSKNPEFWNKIDPYTYLKDISGPVQMHHETGDPSVPVVLSRRLKEELEKQGKTAELFEYQGNDHNIGGKAFQTAMQRTIDFFKKYL
jgi:uncharacterized protein